jgi:hypothetical protein
MNNNHIPQTPFGTETQTQATDALYGQDRKQSQFPTLPVLGDRLSEEQYDISALRHKVDWHIVPIMFLCYLMNLIDKVALNVSAERPGYWSLTDAIASMQRLWASTKT